MFSRFQKGFPFALLLVLSTMPTMNHTSDTNTSTNSLTLSKMNISLTEYISNLINLHFSACSLLLPQDWIEAKQEYGQRANPILGSTPIVSKYVVNFINNSVNSSKLPAQFPLKYSSIRRYTEECMISALFVNRPSINIHFVTQVRDVIAPNFLPLTRKDKYHYIFITEPDNHEALLGIEPFIHKTKFKIAIGISDIAKLIKVSTMDFFGGPNATPKLVSLPNEDVKEIKKVEDTFPDFTWNLRGRILQVTIPYSFSLVEVIHSPQTYWQGINNAKRGRWKYVLEEYLMIKYNFTYRMFPSTGNDGRYGGGGTVLQLKNGTWTGVTGDLYYGRADMGLGIANTDKRTFYIGFTDSIWDLGCMTFVTGQPTKVYSILAMLCPFDTTVWLCIFVATLLTMGFFYVITKFLQRRHLESDSIDCNTQLLLIIAPYVEQDASNNPTSHPLRSFVALWAFYIMIVTTLYRSKLVTLLAFPVLSPIPKDFDELAFSDFDVGFMKVGDASYNTFTRSTNIVYKTLVGRWEVIQGVNLECMEKVVQRGKYACILYDFDVVYLQQRNLTDVQGRKMRYTSSKTYNAWIALALEAHSIYRINFGKTLGKSVPFYLCQIWTNMDLYENVRKPKLKWWAETNHSDLLQREEEVDDDDLTMNNIKGVFFVYFGCLIVSLVAFVNEVCSCTWFKKSLTKLFYLLYFIHIYLTIKLKS